MSGGITKHNNSCTKPGNSERKAPTPADLQTGTHSSQGRFRSIPIEQDTYLLECGRYIERNPIRAGLTDDPAKYRWSSYHVHVEEKQDGLTEPHLLYLGLSNDPIRRKQLYRDYVATDREHEEKKLQEKMKSGFLGSDQLQHVI